MEKVRYIAFKEEDWNYFCKRINWGQSYIDANAARIMNEPKIIEVEEDE